MIEYGSSNDTHMSKFPALATFTNVWGIIGGLLAVILITIALNIIRDEIQSGLAELRKLRKKGLRS
jgi:predicted PurR-regulated permease PerM